MSGTSGSAATTGSTAGVVGLARRAGVPPETVRRYAEDGLIAPARRSGDRGWEYDESHLEQVRFLTGVESLGIADAALRELADAHRLGDCAAVRQPMAEQVAARLVDTQASFNDSLRQQAATGGLAVATNAKATRESAEMAQQIARLQAATTVLAGPPNTGPCTEGCPCTAAAAATVTTYTFAPATDAEPADGAIVCDLAADGGDMIARIDRWQAVLARATRREAIQDGVAVVFGHDIELTAELARLFAAEYRCCSFATYSLVIDGGGVRAEIHTPPEGRLAAEALFGTPTDQPT